MSDDESLKDDFIELCMDRFLKLQFKSKTLEKYWCCSMDMFPKLSEKALSISFHSRRLTCASLGLVLFYQ